MKKVDILVPVFFVIALVVIYFFWGCHLDLYITVLAGVVIVVTCLTTYLQHRKIDKLTEGNKEN